jgi:integrase
MPAQAHRIPKYRIHKARGLAVVRLDGKDHYLGRYESPDSRARYRRLITAWLAGLSAPSDNGGISPPANVSINGVLLRYFDFAEKYYLKDGKPTQEFGDMRLALWPVRELYGESVAAEFGPKKLKAVREKMIADGLCRRVINARINRIRRVFKWAVAEELVPASIHHGLQAVPGLRYGRTEARESEPVKPVPDESVDATLPFLSPQVAAMVQLQRLTGMRPSEIVMMRPSDIERTGATWTYEPHAHKNSWRGHRRLVPLGPKAQKVLEPFMAREPIQYCFSPIEAEAWRSQMRRAARKTPMTPSQLERKPRQRPKRPKRERYDRDSYRRAIYYAVARANSKRPEDAKIGQWCPLQLRHSGQPR